MGKAAAGGVPVTAAAADLAAPGSAGGSSTDTAQLQCGGSNGSGLSDGEVLSLMHFRGRYGDTGLERLAVEAFEDGELLGLIEGGLAAQLQRTKEGATSQTRILELAGR